MNTNASKCPTDLLDFTGDRFNNAMRAVEVYGGTERDYGTLPVSRVHSNRLGSPTVRGCRRVGEMCATA